VPYPDAKQEATLLANVHGGFDPRNLDSVGLTAVDPELLHAARAEVRTVNVQEALFGYIVQLVRKTREWPAVSLGASPRAAVSLMLFAKAIAAIDDRAYIIPDDVKQAALPVLRHRIAVKPEADLEGITPDQILQDVIRSVEVPR
jgi:MoxR-like ATPase